MPETRDPRPPKIRPGRLLAVAAVIGLLLIAARLRTTLRPTRGSDLRDRLRRGASVEGLSPERTPTLSRLLREWDGEREVAREPSRRPPPGVVERLSPAGHTRHLRPVLHLRVPPEADRCELTLHAMCGMGPEVVYREEVRNGTVPFPDVAKDLPAGSLIWFDVVTYRDGERWGEVELDFRTATAEHTRQLDETLAALGPWRERDPVGCAVLEALVLREAGFLDDAARRLLGRPPGALDDPDLVGLLRGLLGGDLGLSEEGIAEFERRFGE